MQRKTSERGEQLLGYVQDSIRKLETGEISRLPIAQELADRFSYENRYSIYSSLRNRGIRLGDYEPPYKLPEPSADLGWFLGVLSAGGTTNQGSGRVRLTNTHENVLEKYKQIGENLFLLNVHKISSEKQSGWSTRPSFGYRFHSTKVARFLGDLRRESWASTILSSHPWVVDDPKYTWGFINGFFEERGKAYTLNRTNQHITIFTSSTNGANLLLEMLVRQDLGQPSINYDYISPVEIKKVVGVSIYNLRDMKLFAQHVHSEVPEKETALEYFRNRTRFSTKPDLYTREKLIQEWKDISNELGRTPTHYDIRKLKKAGKTEISAGTYSYRLGQGSFVKAREELERIIREAS